MPELRPGTVDAHVWDTTVVQNEYALSQLSPEDRVIDIGAHIGGFTVKAHQLGSRNVFAFEPDPENFDLARKNSETLDGIALFNLAVVGSDETAPDTVKLSEYSRFEDGTINTGSVDVFATSASSLNARTVRFDRLLDRETAFVKLDCEGAEWTILYSSQNIRNARRIAGEYHLVDREVASSAGSTSNYDISPSGLRRFFEDRGFDAAVSEPGAEHLGKQLGMFYAVRRTAKTSATELFSNTGGDSNRETSPQTPGTGKPVIQSHALDLGDNLKHSSFPEPNARTGEQVPIHEPSISGSDQFPNLVPGSNPFVSLTKRAPGYRQPPTTSMISVISRSRLSQSELTESPHGSDAPQPQLSQDAIIMPHSIGLGDHLIYSTLPEMFARNGNQVYISNAPGYRNDEVRRLIWLCNPFVSGFSNLPPNAGVVNENVGAGRFTNVVRRYRNSIEAMEAVHGFAPCHKYPKIYYRPRFRKDFCDKVVVDAQSFTQEFPAELFNAFVMHLSLQLGFEALSLVRIFSRFSGQHGSGSTAGARAYTVSDIFEYADIIYSARLVLCTDSGSQALASAIKADSCFPVVYSLITSRSWNRSDFTYPNVKYIVTGKLTDDF